MMGVVYQAKNKVNGKRYVGKTIGIMEDRKKEHKCDANNDSKYPFHCALRKYGFDNFDWKVIGRSDDSSELYSIEQVMIRLRRTKVPNGYNLTDGGQGPSGYHHTKEAIEKIRTASTGRLHTAETKAKIVRTKRENPLSLEMRIKISMAKRGIKHTEKARSKMSLAAKKRRGRFCGPETRAKISASLMSHPVSDSAKARMRKAWKGRKCKKMPARDPATGRFLKGG